MTRNYAQAKDTKPSREVNLAVRRERAALRAIVEDASFVVAAGRSDSERRLVALVRDSIFEEITKHVRSTQKRKGGGGRR